MTTYTWRGPMTSKSGVSLVPGKTVDLDPAESQVQTYLELGYIVAVPETPIKKSKKGDAK